ncbi:hypothetical protein ZIOFF_016378 [Zingiber officinale]|uniref:Myb-like domain-containing protein n=1 Tax=Zingiber officinale TaxID=94328 RepID=A0A8J5LV78_ZINOF|nr:hypothetical protein ZIOFF_016378 [Zingiber officinale]
MVDNSSLFAISSAAAASANTTPADGGHAHHPLKYQPQQPPQMPPPFSHFNSIPITQQLLHQAPPPHHQYFHLFHPPPTHQQQYLAEPRRFIPEHQLGGAAMDQESCPDNSAASGGLPPFLASAMSFKLAVDGGSRERINVDDGSMLRGDDVSGNRPHHWQREDDSAIEELPWRPLDIDYIDRNNKRCKDKEAATGGSNNFSKKRKEVTDSERVEVAGGSNYKIFSELEAIYKPGSSANVGQTGSGSALTGEETIPPVLNAAAMTPPQDAAVGETSAGEEATETVKSSPSTGRRRRRSRRKRRLQQLSAMAAFFESLVKQLMEHQEGLHRKFLEVMERREQERAGREDAWRKQDAANTSREAAARSQERALAASREAAIISFIEKMTGQRLHLPSNPQLSIAEEFNAIQMPNRDATDTYCAGGNQAPKDSATLNTSRWPKAEVEVLIGVRTELEARFQEPGLKAPLWEEVSAAMTAMGYRRSAKRCKEKWENINKYFRKTKEKARNRPEHSKTCPYFQKLDQLYSNTKHPSSSTLLNSQLLEAITMPPPGESSHLATGDEDEEQRSRQEEEEEEDSHGNAAIHWECKMQNDGVLFSFVGSECKRAGIDMACGQVDDIERVSDWREELTLKPGVLVAFTITPMIEANLLASERIFLSRCGNHSSA